MGRIRWDQAVFHSKRTPEVVLFIHEFDTFFAAGFLLSRSYYEATGLNDFFRPFR